MHRRNETLFVWKGFLSLTGYRLLAGVLEVVRRGAVQTVQRRSRGRVRRKVPGEGAVATSASDSLIRLTMMVTRLIVAHIK